MEKSISLDQFRCLSSLTNVSLLLFLWRSLLSLYLLSVGSWVSVFHSVCVEDGWSCQYFLRCNFLAEWPRGSLLWKSLRASGVNPLFGFSRARCDKRQKEAVSSSSLASSPIFLPDTSLRTKSTDTAHFSSFLSHLYHHPVFQFYFSFLSLLFTPSPTYTQFHVFSICLFYVFHTLSLPLSVSVTYISKRWLAL